MLQGVSAEIICPADFRAPEPVKSVPARKPRQLLADRFWSKVATVDDPDACWLWQASAFSSTGYGQFRVVSHHTGKLTMRSAHKVAYELGNGVVLAPCEHILHSPQCTSRLCCRPAHLRRGSRSENARDAVAAGTHAKRKLTAEKAREIVARRQAGEKRAALAAAFGVTPQCIDHVVRGRCWGAATGLKPAKPRTTGTRKRRNEHVGASMGAA